MLKMDSHLQGQRRPETVGAEREHRYNAGDNNSLAFLRKLSDLVHKESWIITFPPSFFLRVFSRLHPFMNVLSGPAPPSEA